MKTIFVSRHPGALEWIKRQGVTDLQVVSHLDVSTVRMDDTVIGTLPINMAAQLYDRGCRFLYLEMNIPESHRGRELSAQDMDRFGAKLVEYEVSRIHLIHWVLRDAISGDPILTSINEPEFADMPCQWQGREAYWSEETVE